MTTIQIRPAIETDVSDLLALIRAKADFDGCLASLRLDETTLRSAFFGEAPKAQALVAIVDTRAVGMATWYEIYSSFLARPGLWLDDLFVDLHCRQLGVGKALMTSLCVLARDKGCARIDWIVASDNDRGRVFYERLGASIFEQVRHARLDEAAIARLTDQTGG